MLTLTLVCGLCAPVSASTSLQLAEWSPASPLGAEIGEPPSLEASGSTMGPTKGMSWDVSTYVLSATLAAEAGLAYAFGIDNKLPAGRLAVDWAGAYAATLPVSALLAAVAPRSREQAEHASWLFGLAWAGLGLVGTPAAATGGVAAMEALAGHTPQGPALWNAAVGGLVGYGATIATVLLESLLFPKEWSRSLGPDWRMTWGDAMAVFALAALTPSASTATAYSWHYKVP